MLGEYDAGYENYIDSLIREIEKLQDENDKLSEQVSSLVGRSFRTADKMSCIEADNAKLRELVRDMYGFIERTDEECGDVTFSDCFDYCKHDATDDGCCKTGECWYEQRMRELGVGEDA